MQSQELKQSFTINYNYSVLFNNDIFNIENELINSVISQSGEGPHKVAVIIDSGVLKANPTIALKIKAYFKHYSENLALVNKVMVVVGGEVCKTAPLEVQQFYDLVATNAICRHSFVLAIGGGAMLDAIGYAAATAHRGINLIRIPTTVLAQNDAGVGVKNAINHQQRKNFIGTFAPPYAVINDYSLLDSLSERDKRAGIAEALKVALIKDSLFYRYLHEKRKELAVFDEPAMQHMIYRCAQLHLEHIANNGDPFEQGSARPLDFGHWAAHKLEEISHSTVRHGEAVAIGIMLDTLYSWRIGNISSEEAESIYFTLIDIGFDIYHYEMGNMNVDNALEEFREHLGGDLCITLIDSVGKGKEYSIIEVSLMQACIDDLKKLYCGLYKTVFAVEQQVSLDSVS